MQNVDDKLQSIHLMSESELTKRISYLFDTFTRTDYDSLFRRASDGENIPFQNIFPPQPTAFINNYNTITNKGGEIDKYRCVIRFNQFQIPGHEHNVGSKTTHWVTDNVSSVRIQPESSFYCLLLTPLFVSFEKKRQILIRQYGEKNLRRFLIFDNNELLRLVRIAFHCIPSAALILLLLVSVRYRDMCTYGYEASKKTYYGELIPENIYEKVEQSIYHLLRKKQLIKCMSSNRTYKNVAKYPSHSPSEIPLRTVKQQLPRKNHQNFKKQKSAQNDPSNHHWRKKSTLITRPSRWLHSLRQ